MPDGDVVDLNGGNSGGDAIKTIGQQNGLHFIHPHLTTEQINFANLIPDSLMQHQQSVAPSINISASNNANAGTVFPSEFLQSLQQAGGLPATTVLPYDQSQQQHYIGQFMYLPYQQQPPAATSQAESNGLLTLGHPQTNNIAYQQNGTIANSATSSLTPLLTAAQFYPNGQTATAIQLNQQQQSYQLIGSDQSGGGNKNDASDGAARSENNNHEESGGKQSAKHEIVDLQTVSGNLLATTTTSASIANPDASVEENVAREECKRDHNGSGQYSCNVCGREFGMKCRLVAHARRHTGERPYPCNDCGRTFSDRGNLQRHRYTHSSQPRFHCNVCTKSFRQASCLSNHRRFHCAGATGRPCPFCQRSFRSSSSLQMHIRWKHRSDAAAALAAAAAVVATSSSSMAVSSTGHQPRETVSDDRSSQAQATSAIAVNHEPGQLFDLNGCNLLSSTSLGYSTTQLTGASTISTSNSVPFLSSPTTISLDNKLTTSNNNGPISANKGIHYPLTASMLALHHAASQSSSSAKRKWRRKPKPPQNAFGCLSGDTYNILAGIDLTDSEAAAAAAGAAAAQMGGPVPIDRKGRPCNFPCPACPRRFAFQCRLAAHLRCHTNIRPFMCAECGRAFTQRGYLVRHAAVHKLDRPFTCTLCDRSYKHYGSLVNHRRTHNKLGLSQISLINQNQQQRNALLDQINSGLADAVGTALLHSEKYVSNTSGVANSTPTVSSIALLPVSKIDDDSNAHLNSLPSSASLQNLCLPSSASTLIPVTDQFIHQGGGLLHQDALVRPQHHQLTATAVWPILSSSSSTNHHHQNTSDFSNSLSIVSPSQIGAQQSSLNTQQQHALVHASKAGGTPTLVSLPLPQSLASSSNSVFPPHQLAQQQFLAQQSSSSSVVELPVNNNTTALSSSVNNAAAQLVHVLQPSSSGGLLLQPYYHLPHSAS